MEGLTRLVSESMARHGFDRPLDYRRLHWSRWFRCESPHSLLFVPSKPGVFAVAEEIMQVGDAHVGVDAFVRPPIRSEAQSTWDSVRPGEARQPLAASIPNPTPRRMLAVAQFFEDDDMAFVLDRMLSRQNPMQSRLISGRYFVRFVVIEDQAERRTICNALNQWMISAAEKATGIGSHFATSLELTPATEYIAPAEGARVGADAFVRPASFHAHVATIASAVPRSEASGPSINQGSSAGATSVTAPQLDSGAATDTHRPCFPSGF